jgi:hypothetical protein
MNIKVDGVEACFILSLLRQEARKTENSEDENTANCLIERINNSMIEAKETKKDKWDC